MAHLVNRKYGSRFECLYYILKSINNNFGDKEFIISEVKVDESNDTPLNHCNNLINRLGINFCPFLENAMDMSKCYAIQSIYSDTTKSKAASDVVRSLEALGMVDSIEDKFRISNKGREWCNLGYFSLKSLELLEDSVLGYGPVIGYLKEAMSIGKEFNHSDIFIGYPDSKDPIPLSTGSTKDSNTRTTSKIATWCVAAGLIEPANNLNTQNKNPLIFYKYFIDSKRMTVRKFKINDNVYDKFNEKLYVNKPLSYPNLNKNVGSLRERGIETIRENTMVYNDIVLSRRYVIIQALNKSSLGSKKLDLLQLINNMNKWYSQLFLPNSKVNEIIQSEINIAKVVGIPFKPNPIDNTLEPLSILNENELNIDCPKEIQELANKVCDFI